MSFAPAGTPAAPAYEAPRQGQTAAPDWDAIATGKIASNIVVALVGSGADLVEVKKMIPAAFDVAKAIMAYQTPHTETVPNGLGFCSHAQDSDDIEVDVESIPFRRSGERG
jgi:hypothetical protein